MAQKFAVAVHVDVRTTPKLCELRRLIDCIQFDLADSPTVCKQVHDGEMLGFLSKNHRVLIMPADGPKGEASYEFVE